MKDFYCSSCGQRLFGSEDIVEKKHLLRIPGYTLDCYVLRDDADLSALKHRDEEFLNEVWSCCRISLMRLVRGGEAGHIIAYTDNLAEAARGETPPAPVQEYKSRELTEKDFDQVIAYGALPENADKLYIVKFTALWCPPCRAMDYVFRSIKAAGDLKNVEFFEVDSDNEQDLTDRFLAPSVPYIVFFKGGKRLDASRFTLRSVNGGLSEALSEADFRELCKKMLES